MHVLAWNNTRVSAKTVRHKSTYIILFLTRHNESINDQTVLTTARDKWYLTRISILFTAIFTAGRVRNCALPTQNQSNYDKIILCMSKRQNETVWMRANHIEPSSRIVSISYRLCLYNILETIFAFCFAKIGSFTTTWFHDCSREEPV